MWLFWYLVWTQVVSEIAERNLYNSINYRKDDDNA